MTRLVFTADWQCRFVLFAMLATSPAVADEALGRRAASFWDSLLLAAEAAPAPHEALESARGRLRSSIQPLREFLATGGTQKESLWAQWLELPALEAQLTAQAPDVALLAEHLDRLHLDRSGLELAPFVAVREELRRFLAVTEFSAATAPDDLFRSRLYELSDCLARLDAVPTAQDSHDAGRLVAWFDSLGGDSAEIAAAVRQNYCRTNALGQISSRFVNLILQRDVQCQQLIAETMLGSYTRGVAFTTARVSTRFVPSREHATLELLLLGHTASPSNIAQRGRVSVYTSAGTTISANKQVFINDQGFQLAPAAASTATNLRINDISAGRRFVERLAWRRADRITPQAEAAVSQRARAEASTKLDQQAASALAGINNLINHQIRAPLIRRNALPRDWQFWSDDDHLRVSLAQHNSQQFAPASTAPQFPPAYDIAVAAHESMIVNLSESMLGGETIEDHRWLEFAKYLRGYPPPALMINDHSPRWSVTFATDLPALARFDDGRIEFTLRLAEVKHGDRHFNHAISIDACYRPHSTPAGLALLREGHVVVRPDERAPSDESMQIKTLLTEKFDAIVPPELHFYGMSPPAGGALCKLNLLDLTEFKSTRGWLTLAYQLKGSSPRLNLAAQ